MKRLTRNTWKFFFGGEGLSFVTGRYALESILVGAVTGLVVVAFKYLIHGTEHLVSHLTSDLFRDADTLVRATRLCLVPIGAVLGYVVMKLFSSVAYARGTGSAISAYHQQGGNVPWLVAPVKGVSSVLTVGFGGSAGYEGPVTLIGAACGSTVDLKGKCAGEENSNGRGSRGGHCGFVSGPDGRCHLRVRNFLFLE